LKRRQADEGKTPKPHPCRDNRRFYKRIGFRRYLKLWNERRDKVLGWSDATLTGSDKTLATRRGWRRGR